MAMAVTLAWGRLQDAQTALPAVRFLTGRFDNGCFFFSPRKRARGHPYSHHVPTWYILGLVDTPQTSSMGRRLFSAAKRNQSCLPGPEDRVFLAASSKGQQICGVPRTLSGVPLRKMGGMHPGEALEQQDLLSPALAPRPGRSCRVSGSCMSTLLCVHRSRLQQALEQMEEKCSVIEIVQAQSSPGFLLWACAVPCVQSTAGETEAEQLNGVMWMGFNCFLGRGCSPASRTGSLPIQHFLLLQLPGPAQGLAILAMIPSPSKSVLMAGKDKGATSTMSAPTATLGSCKGTLVV